MCEVVHMINFRIDFLQSMNIFLRSFHPTRKSCVRTSFCSRGFLALVHTQNRSMLSIYGFTKGRLDVIVPSNFTPEMIQVSHVLLVQPIFGILDHSSGFILAVESDVTHFDISLSLIGCKLFSDFLNFSVMFGRVLGYFMSCGVNIICNDIKEYSTVRKYLDSVSRK